MKKYVPALIVLSPIITGKSLTVLTALADESLRLLSECESAVEAIVILSKPPPARPSVTHCCIALDDAHGKRLDQYEVYVEADGSLCSSAAIDGPARSANGVNADDSL
ncbi:hypothetical protein MUP46_03720 [Patescibacteria group bacterium]|nr:hypothetical protein [Patescibacteria group bacterium]